MSYFMTRNPLPVKSRSGVSPQERGQTYTFDKENHLVKCVGLTPLLRADPDSGLTPLCHSSKVNLFVRDANRGRLQFSRLRLSCRKG